MQLIFRALIRLLRIRKRVATSAKILFEVCKKDCCYFVHGFHLRISNDDASLYTSVTVVFQSYSGENASLNNGHASSMIKVGLLSKRTRIKACTFYIVH